MRDEIIEKLKTFLQNNSEKVIDFDNFNEVTPIESFGMDSLYFMELLFEIEDAFSVKIENENFRGITTVGDLVTYLENEISNYKPSSSNTPLAE